eukprot:3341065-Ditylum_brightwellii.AAC.3
MNLWNADSIAKVFYNKKLLSRNPLEEGLPTQCGVDLIIKKYVDLQLLYTPCSKSDLQSLYYDMNEKCNDYLVMLKEELVNKLQSIVVGCPSKEDLMNATKYSPLNWESEICGIFGQSEESLGELRLVLTSLKAKVDKYR